MKTIKASDTVAGALKMDPVEVSNYELNMKIPLDRKFSLVYGISPKEMKTEITSLNPDLVTYTTVARPKFTDKEVYAGAALVKGNFIAELSTILRDRTEELMGGDAKETKGIPSLRLRIGADLANWLKTRLSLTSEDQTANFYGNITRQGTMYNLDYKKSSKKGEWSDVISADTNIEFANELISGRTISGGLCIGYTQHDNTITVKGMSEVKRLDSFFYPKLYIMYNPSPDFGLNLEWKGLMSKLEEGAEKGVGGVIEVRIKNLKLKLATEAMGNYKNNTLSVNYTLK
jgi:hypothetical protein